MVSVRPGEDYICRFVSEKVSARLTRPCGLATRRKAMPIRKNITYKDQRTNAKPTHKLLSYLDAIPHLSQRTCSAKHTSTPVALTP